jgi:anti-sigma B factor antagonist
LSDIVYESLRDPMEVLKTALAGVPLLRVIGDIDHVSAPALEAAIQQALGMDHTRLLLDLAGSHYVDSGGLSVLLFACRQVRDEGWLGVIAPDANVLRLFEIVGLTTARGFRVFSSSEEALAALEG